MKMIRMSLRLASCVVLSVSAASLTGCGGGARYERSAGEYVDDKIVVSRVAAALANDPEYKYEDVIVTSHQGMVQLSGFVAAGDQKGKAEAIADKVPGVKDVDNKITVRP
jgi:hyperosmotically inducible protein